MKKVIKTTGNILTASFLTVLPMALGMALSGILTGELDMAFRFDMVLLGIGAALTVLAFRKGSSVDMPSEQKTSAKLSVWYTMFGFFSTLIILCIMLHGADEDPVLDIAKQAKAVFLGPVVEELICRYLLTNVIKNGSKSKALSVFTAVFTTVAWILPHAHSSVFLNVRLLLIGLVASLVYQKTGSLKTCIIAHAASNAAVTLALAVGLPLGNMAVIAGVSVMTAVSAVFFIREIAKEFTLDRKAVEIKVVPAAE